MHVGCTVYGMHTSRCFQCAACRPLVEGVKELVKIPEHLWGLKCCIFIAMHQAPAIAHGFATSSRSRTGVSTTARSSHHDDHADTEPGPVIVYANAAAQGALKPQLLAGGPAGNSAADSHSHTTTHLTQGDMKLEGQPAAAVIPNIDKVINQVHASVIGADSCAHRCRQMWAPCHPHATPMPVCSMHARPGRVQPCSSLSINSALCACASCWCQVCRPPCSVCTVEHSHASWAELPARQFIPANSTACGVDACHAA